MMYREGYYHGNPRNWLSDTWIHQNSNGVIVFVYHLLSSFGFLATPKFVDSRIGGSSVELHIVANEGKRLFSGAIAQSAFRTPLPTPEEQQVRKLPSTTRYI